MKIYFGFAAWGWKMYGIGSMPGQNRIWFIGFSRAILK